MGGEKYILFLTLALAMLIILPSVSASITMDAPSELISNSVAKITLHFNEPLIERYANNIQIDCENCFAASKNAILYNNGVVMGPTFRGHRYLDILYSGEKTLSFFIVGSYSDPAEDENAALWDTANLKLSFQLDEDKMKKDYPDMFIPSAGASLSKKFDILDSELIITLPKIGDFKHEHFDSDRYTYGSPDLSISEYTFEDTNYYTRYYTVDVDSEMCAGDEKGDQFHSCGGEITQEMIDTGKVNDGWTLKKINWHDGSGYALVYPQVIKTFKVWEGGKVKFNAALLSLTYKYSILDEKTGTNYFGYLSAESGVKEGFQDVFYETTAREFEEIINSTHLKKIGSRTNTYDAEYKYMLSDFTSPDNVEGKKEDNGECATDQDCSEEKVCNACGECVNHAIDPASVNTEIELKNKLSSKSIYNSIREQMMITTKVIPTFMYNGKKIDYCDIAAPGIKKELVAEMKNSNPYAGFLLLGDLFNEERTKTKKTIIDFSEKPLEYHFLISPNDKKKVIGELGEVTENIEIKVEGLAITNEKLILKPVDLSMDMKSAGVQLQEDSNKLIRITPKDKYAKHIYFKASMAGPGEIELGEASFKQVYTKTKPGETIKLMYYSPEMGNFDIGEELASLSMVNLQKDAAKQIAEDAVLAYAGDAFQGMEDLHNAETATKNYKAGISAVRGFLRRNPGKYNPTKVAEYVKKFSSAAQNSKKLDLAAKSYKLYSGTYGLSQIPKGTVSMRDDMHQAVKESNDKANSRKTWTESVAEYGIVGIDVAQTGVSMLTFLPNKIPVFGKMTAGAKIAFSAMTNIWKANLKYLATEEKINRAKEHLYPVMILMTAEDESGWQLTQGYILQVAFHEI